MTRQVVHTKRARIAFGFSTNGEKWVERLRWLVRGGKIEREDAAQLFRPPPLSTASSSYVYSAATHL